MLFIVDIMLEVILTTVGQYWYFILPAVLVSYLASNYFSKGLNQYPGPFLARLTDAWRFVDVWNRRPDITHIKLHRKHGDVVRLGPNALSFSDPAAIKTIYGLNKGFVKVAISLFSVHGAATYVISLASTRPSKLCPKAGDYLHCSRPPTSLTMLSSAVMSIMLSV